MKHLFIALSCLLMSASFLEAAKEQKIGYVDTEYIIENYQTAIDAKRAYEAEINKYKRNADSLKQLYNAAEAELESQKLMLSEQGKSAKLIEVTQLKNQYDDYVTSVWGTGGKIEQKNRELITPIVQTIQTAVQQIAISQGFTLILDASEAKIVYAQSGLDITDLVLDELNKEYAPSITPPPVVDKEVSVAVFPIFEESQEAQTEHVGETMRSAIYDLTKGASQIRMISIGEINNALLTRNINLNSQISEADAYSLGRILQADFIVTGTVNKQGNKVNFMLKVDDPLNSKNVYQGSGDAPRIEELKQSIGNLVQQAIKKIKPEK
jgi:outer membrane protein